MQSEPAAIAEIMSLTDELAKAYERRPMTSTEDKLRRANRRLQDAADLLERELADVRKALRALGVDYDGDGWHYFACPTRHGFKRCDAKCKSARAALGEE